MNKGGVSAAAFAFTDIYIILIHKFTPDPTVFVRRYFICVKLLRGNQLSSFLNANCRNVYTQLE